MTRPDPRDFENLLTRPDPTREILKPFDPTRPDPRDFENLLTRPDPTREILKRDNPTRPDPRDFETPLTRPAGRVMTREKPCIFAEGTLTYPDSFGQDPRPSKSRQTQGCQEALHSDAG